MDDFFYRFRFDKVDDYYGEYVEFPFPSKVDADIDIDDYYIRCLSRSLSKSEEEFFYNYLLSNLDSKKHRDYADSIYKYILMGNGNLTTAEIVFTGQYTMYLNYEKMKYDKDGNVKEGYEKMTIPPLRIYKSIKDDGFFRKDCIGIDYQLAIAGDGIKLYDFIQTICHEMRHFQQDYQSRNNILNVHSFEYFVDQNVDKSGQSSCNYWFLPIEIDAEEYGDQEVLELLKTYAPERTDLINKYKEHLMKLSINKSLAFSLLEEEHLYLTDVSDIMWLFREADNTLQAEEEIPGIMDEFISLLTEKKIIPNLFKVDSNKQLKLLSEQTLLMKYYSSTAEDKGLYEKALLFYYTLDKNETKNYIIDENVNIDFFPGKERFIKEQLDKEEVFLNNIKMVQKNPDYLVRGDPKTKEKVFSNLIKEIMQIRIKRIQNYKIFLDVNDKMAAWKASLIADELKNIAIKLSYEVHNDEITNMFNSEGIPEEFINNIDKKNSIY